MATAVDEGLTASNTYIETELCARLARIGECMDADVLTCIHPIGAPFDDFVRDRIEDISDKHPNLLVILETEGGSIETTERIADVFRHHYSGEVSFLIPNFAMSAGTILVMSGDRILMDYYSILGPIDPQVHTTDGKIVPAVGYLEKYRELVKKSADNELTQAELAFLIEKFDPADLHRLEQAREHSVDLLKRWLVKNKFKNWTVTRTNKTVVTHKMKLNRAQQIANKLNDTRRWRSHGRGLSIAVVEQELNLMVEDFGTDPALAELNRRVRHYYRLLQDYMARRGAGWVLHSREGLFGPWKLS